MKVERLSRWMPAPLRRVGGALLRRSRQLPPALAGWDHPIIGEGPIHWPPPVSESGGLPPDEERASRASLRCLLVTGTLDAGGMDEFVAFLARGLRRYGIETAALLAPLDEGKPGGNVAIGLTRSGIPVVDGASDRSSAEAWVRGWRPDVIAVHGNATWPVDLGNAAGIPVVLVLHGMHDLFGASEAEVVARFRKLSMVICVSELVRRQYLAISSELDDAKVVTIPNGVDARRTSGVDRSSARASAGDEQRFGQPGLRRRNSGDARGRGAPRWRIGGRNRCSDFAARLHAGDRFGGACHPHEQRRPAPGERVPPVRAAGDPITRIVSHQPVSQQPPAVSAHVAVEGSKSSTWTAKRPPVAAARRTRGTCRCSWAEWSSC